MKICVQYLKNFEHSQNSGFLHKMRAIQVPHCGEGTLRVHTVLNTTLYSINLAISRDYNEGKTRRALDVSN
jgi:hypothetical protein